MKTYIQKFNLAYILVLIPLSFISLSLNSQSLTGVTASGSSSTSSDTFVTVTGASTTIDVTGINDLLVVSTFQVEMNSPGTDTREASYRLAYDGDPENVNSDTIKRSLSNIISKDFGIGSQVHIFDVSSYSGNQTFSLQHAFAATSRTLTTSATVVAITLKGGSEHLKNDAKIVPTPVIMGTSWASIIRSETNVLSSSVAGGFYVAASIESLATTFNTAASAEWKLQYKEGIGGTWVDLSASVERTMGNSTDRGIINLVGTLPDDTPAGNYYFRIAHKRTSATSIITTEAANIVAVSLGIGAGVFPVFRRYATGVTTSSSSKSPAISDKLIPAINTDVFIHTQYSLSADAETNSPVYDIYVDNSILDGNDQKRYILDATSSGSGSSVGLATGLLAGTAYNVSLRHASASSNTLTSDNLFLSGFGLTVNAGPLPIELLSFDANSNENNIIVNWETASEINNEYFSLSRSSDGINWKEVAKIKGSVNSRDIQSYEFIDNDPNNGVNYYKLKQTDVNGKFEEFDIIYLNHSAQVNYIELYPNPAVDFINIHFNNNISNKDLVNITLINTWGQIVCKESISNLSFSNEYYFEIPQNITTGNYILRISNDKSILYSNRISIIK